jgi:hypothetical protein
MPLTSSGVDRRIPEALSTRMGAKTIEVKASHVSLISQPDAIAELILEAAAQK